MTVKKGRQIADKPVLLWIGDAVAHTGFSTVTHAVLDNLHRKWDVNVLGINYFGDPHPYAYKVWPASGYSGDVYGISRLPDLLQRIRPAVVCILNDPWVANSYISVIQDHNKRIEAHYAKMSETRADLPPPVFVKIVLYTPIDALNIKSDFVEPLNVADRVVAYTEFGVNEMRKGGLTAETAVIPHGIDVSQFYPMPRQEARRVLNLPLDWYIVGLINRNQPRKRLDLAIEYMAAWTENKPSNVKFYYHGALSDVGWDVVDLCRYYGIEDRLILTSDKLSAYNGVSRDVLRAVYNSFDVQISTTMGEGWGLTTMEGMACRVPQIVPDWSALGEWPRGAVHYVECTSKGSHTGGINTIGGIADKIQFIEALERMYVNTDYRASIAEAGYKLVRQPQFTWSSVAARFDAVFKEVVND
jgi:glycosyltransferase involved in cell wall biosynthesis